MRKRILIGVISICALCTGFARKIPRNYIDMKSEEFHENFIDMREVSDFKVTGNELKIYLHNGDVYCWER